MLAKGVATTTITSAIVEEASAPAACAGAISCGFEGLIFSCLDEFVAVRGSHLTVIGLFMHGFPHRFPFQDFSLQTTAAETPNW